MKKRFLLVIVPGVLVVIVLLIGSSPYAWIASKELAAGSHGPSAVQQDVIRAYYEALDTCDVKAFERLSIRGPDDPQWAFSGLWPNENIQWAKLLSISGPYPANEGDAYKHGAVYYLKSKPAGLVRFRVEEVIKRKEKWWPDKDTNKSILMVKETEDSSWLIAAIGHG
jgi:hypothetical protein